MKVVTAETMQLLDRQAISEFGIPGLGLMERAGRGCADIILALYGKSEPRRAVVVAGKGNNGGDGYVIARILQDHGWDVKTLVLARRAEISGDAAINLDRLNPITVCQCHESQDLASFAAEMRKASVIVDAIFGTGLKTPVGGIYAHAIELMAESGRPIVAVDIPSGIDASTGNILGKTITANVTVTFAVGKLGHVLYPAAEHIGNLRLVDIGIPSELIAAAPGYEFIDAEAIRPLIARRRRTAHKGDFGHCLIVAGSSGKTGAAAMAANSAVRAGSGLVTVAVPASLNAILEVKTTEAMTLPLPDEGKGILTRDSFMALEEAMAGKDVMAVGPGISWNSETAEFVRRLVCQARLPLVVDADALNSISEDTGVLARRGSGALVITPHPGEMARLVGTSVKEVENDRIGTASSFAARSQVYVVLKGARTIIAAPDGRIAINGSGNPGMATGGMGDVLTGIITSLLGRGYDPFDACRLGVYLHGFSADIVAAELGENGMTAVDVQERLPIAWKRLLESD